jgi:hypothetical protein
MLGDVSFSHDAGDADVLLLDLIVLLCGATFGRRFLAWVGSRKRGERFRKKKKLPEEYRLLGLPASDRQMGLKVGYQQRLDGLLR